MFKYDRLGRIPRILVYVSKTGVSVLINTYLAVKDEKPTCFKRTVYTIALTQDEWIHVFVGYI